MDSRYILLVNDEFTDHYAEDLRSIGFQNIKQASNGREAMKILKTKEGICKLLLTDYSMPELNGIELINAILENDIQVPAIILASAHPSKYLNIGPLTRNLERNHIRFLYLNKAFSSETFLKSVMGIIDGGRI